MAVASQSRVSEFIIFGEHVEYNTCMNLNLINGRNNQVAMLTF